MKIALAQINPVVGDIRGNSALMAGAIDAAADAGAALVVFPELSIVGYPPRDLLRKEAFVADNVRAVEQLASRCTRIAALVGYARPSPHPRGRPLQNAAALLEGGRIRHVHVKSLLPTYDVFDETRYFEPGGNSACVDVAGQRIGISVCEDLWDPRALGRPLYDADPVAELARQGAKVIINLAASPYQMGKMRLREELFARQAVRCRTPIVYVNQVGGNDELIFDGSSCVIDCSGAVIARARSFEPDLLLAELQGPVNRLEEPKTELAALADALRLGLRDYVRKCGFAKVVLGLSGGIDSAVVAVLAADALGPQNVLALAMPSRYSSDHSLADARELARRCGINFAILPIEPMHAAYESALRDALAGGNIEIASENVQARIRGNIVMAVSNALGHLALATGNKSELSTGYCTLYGDMAGGLAPIGDALKTTIFELARELNRGGDERIPQAIIDKPPSAELKPNQFDQDTLPPYDVLDAILQQYVEDDLTAGEIIDKGFDAETVRRVVRMVDCSEYKRKQAAPVLKVSARAFGSGRRMPIAQRYG
jgi:NAD+ synthetase